VHEPAWSIYISDFHSSCIRLSPPARLSQQASIDPSGVGQHSPEIPSAAHPVLIVVRVEEGSSGKCVRRRHKSEMDR
jgi:hypothetical protein